MKTILALLVVVLVLLAFVYQVALVTPGYDKEARRQYNDTMEALRLYGRTMRSDGNSATMIAIVSDVQRRMTSMHPPLRRLSWHALFVWQLGKCRRVLENADVVGSFAAADGAITTCAAGLLPLGG